MTVDPTWLADVARALDEEREPDVAVAVEAADALQSLLSVDQFDKVRALLEDYQRLRAACWQYRGELVGMWDRARDPNSVLPPTPGTALLRFDRLIAPHLGEE